MLNCLSSNKGIDRVRRGRIECSRTVGMIRFGCQYNDMNPPSSSIICLKRLAELGVVECDNGMAINLVRIISMGERRICVSKWLVTPKARGTPGEGRAVRGTSGLRGGREGERLTMEEWICG